MGSLFAPEVESTPVPPDNTVYNFVDNVGGTKGTRVQNADGSYTMVYEKLPLSAEDQAYQDRLKQIETESLDWIQKISADPNYQSDYVKTAVKNYVDSNTKSVQQAYTTRTQAEEENLARYGVDDSSAGAQLRSQRGRDLQTDLTQINKDANDYAEQARQEDLNQATNLYTLASGRGDQALATALTSLGQSQNAALNLSNLSQQRQLALYQSQQAYNQAKANAQAQGWQTFGQLAGSAVGAAGGFGSTSGMWGGYSPSTGITWASGRRGTI